MHIDIDNLGLCRKKENGKGKVVLHHAVTVAILDGLRKQRALDIAPVDAVVFERATAP